VSPEASAVAETTFLENVLRRDRRVVIAALSVIIVAGWAYVLSGAGMGMSAFDMTSLTRALGPSHDGTADMAAMATPAAWNAGYAVLMATMWWVMMIAMMLPSAAPMILLHAKVDRRQHLCEGEAGGVLSTGTFLLGYLLVWGLFSVAAAGLQWAFEGAGVLSPMTLNSTNAVFAGFILLFAGIYQLTPIKRACLRHCRGPISFLSRHWRPGARGAFVMGLHHGAYCVGCCWGLMAILFFGGVMNLYWVIGLALIVLMEKVMPLGARLSIVTGGLLVMWSASIFYRAVA
jgi:predicted metal-binding membrane protein